jgi:hypothetical protein
MLIRPGDQRGALGASRRHRDSANHPTTPAMPPRRHNQRPPTHHHRRHASTRRNCHTRNRPPQHTPATVPTQRQHDTTQDSTHCALPPSPPTDSHASALPTTTTPRGTLPGGGHRARFEQCNASGTLFWFGLGFAGLRVVAW